MPVKYGQNSGPEDFPENKFIAHTARASLSSSKNELNTSNWSI